MGLDIYTHRLTKTKSDNFFELDDKQVTQFKKMDWEILFAQKKKHF